MMTLIATLIVPLGLSSVAQSSAAKLYHQLLLQFCSKVVLEVLLLDLYDNFLKQA